MRLLQSGKDAVYLTRVELSLLIAFMDSPLRILSRSYLASVTHIHGRVTDRAVDVQILRLRKKLGSDIIESIRGQGYRFTENVEYVNQS
jgi:two-component system OmpR family response regulator